ncbi:MAG: CDP-alcohol phosphatidyltransferase family protein [Candidatus Diapherotrites archaeon CG10_big_fil_rev_8_21_14_0_10_31_34]|nr:MAG: CDP-alcohol phosphatidyltransferase family protein [Candidatus Diapherotrites archaeon CG10_big_fil_rev_8_21_14_0_10_31_34]PJA16555.1 MAG: CDP-alcohol phosphatidyltransferase family protein [Candidatus Diapherotrites archaeon CG_4_10_14_0_2_um_filter_31_5]
MISQNREKFKAVSIKTGLIFGKLPLTPNQWTLFSLIPALLCFYFLLKANFVFAVIFFALAAFIDVIDGAVARVQGKTTKKGAYLDTITDRYVELIVFLGLFLTQLPLFYFSSQFWIFLALFGSIMTTYSKAAAKEKLLLESELKGGLMERPERLILLFLVLLSAIFNLQYTVYLIALFAVLTNLSAFQRILKAFSLA